MLLNYKQKSIFYIDFDTIFSSYIQTKTLNYDLSFFSDFKLILPQIENMELIFKEVISSLSPNSILILDSLNGLIDCLNIWNLLKSKNKNTNKNKSTIVVDKKSSKYRSAGYQSLNILFLLLKKIENKNIPIVVTVYQSIEKSKKMINELLSNQDFKTNHFIRISNMILFLGFMEENYKTGYTIMKKNFQPNNTNTISLPTLSSSFSSSDKNSPVFYPYSRWYYYNYFN